MRIGICVDLPNEENALVNASLQTGVIFGRMCVNECRLSVDKLIHLQTRKKKR